MLFKRDDDLDEMILMAHLRGCRKYLVEKADKFSNSHPDTIQNAIDILERAGLEGNSTPGIICGGPNRRDPAVGAVNTGAYIFFRKDRHEVAQLIESARTPPMKGKVAESVLARMAAERMEDIQQAELQFSQADNYSPTKKLIDISIPQIRSVKEVILWFKEFRGRCIADRIYAEAGLQARNILKFIDRPDVTDEVISKGYDLHLVKRVQGE